MTGFTTREAARILDLPEARVRACVRAGFVAPARGRGGRLEFSFQDLLVLRTTKDLLAARIPARRIRRMLASLRRQLPDDAGLASVSIYADGRRIVAWDGRARWQPDSGQFLFNFDAEAVARRVSPPRLRLATPGRLPGSEPPDAEHWLQIASALESTSPDEAKQAYHQALAAEPGNVEAHINLGRLYHQERDFVRAEAHYREAGRRAPDDPIPLFNLGVLMDDRGRRDEAIGFYRRALERDPEFADAHYNLGLLYEAMGRRSQAITHLRAARRLYDRNGTGR